MSYERVLVFGAHPDDELAMARTIARLAHEGSHVTVVIMTDGCEGYPKADMQGSIVKTRADEARACDAVLGIHRRLILSHPDMALTNDKATVQESIRIIREVRPHAVFMHGPDDVHRDHVASHAIVKSACFHAGERVALALGEPWKPPCVYYHRGVSAALPRVVVDVTPFRTKRLEAMVTQVSQYTVFRETGATLAARIDALRQQSEPCYDLFWLAEWMRFRELLPLGYEAPDNYHGER